MRKTVPPGLLRAVLASLSLAVSTAVLTSVAALAAAPTGVAAPARPPIRPHPDSNSLIRSSKPRPHTSPYAAEIITAIAGGGNQQLINSIPATDSTLLYPTSVAVDSLGNVYVADPINTSIRKIDHTTAIITTFAGGQPTWADNVPATSTYVYPLDIAIGPDQNLYLVDHVEGEVRKIDLTTNIMTTIAGAPPNATYGCTQQTDEVGDGCPATQALLQEPNGLAFDTAGNLYIADLGDAFEDGAAWVRMVSASTGVISIVAGVPPSASQPSTTPPACAQATDLTGDGCLATEATILPNAVAIDSSGNLYIAEDNDIREVDHLTGIITTIAGLGTGCTDQTDTEGDGCTALEATIKNNTEIGFDSTGSLYFVDNASVRVIDASSGLVSIVAGGGSEGSSECAQQTDLVGDGCPAKEAIMGPYGFTFDLYQNLLIADAGNQLVRQVGSNTALLPPTAEPSFSPAPGTYPSTQTITLEDATGGALIYYTTDGSTPTASSTQFTSPFSVATTTKVQAIAIAQGYTKSPVAPATYTIQIPTPTLAISPASLAFSSLSEGKTSAAQTITLTNTGKVAVTLAAASIAGSNPRSFVQTASTCASTLLADTSCTLSVAFEPSTTGSLSATLLLANSATGSLQSVALKGTAAAAPQPSISVSPASLTFTAIATGQTSAAQTVTLSNTGNVSITLDTFTVLGTNPKSFLKSAQTCGTALAAGKICTLSIVEKPAVTGPLSASLLITASVSGSSQSVAPPAITFKGTGLKPAGSTLVISPASLTFASLTEGQTSAAQTVTLKNTGTASVNFGAIVFTGLNTTSFVKTTSTCATSVAPGKTCTMSIAFKPSIAGSLTASLAIADNAAGTPQLLPLKGTSTAAPTVSITPAALSFTAQAVGSSSKPQLITIRNTSNTTVNFGATLFTGKNTKSFVKSATTCAPTLAPAKSCTISVEFKPAVTGELTASLAIADNGPHSPQFVTLAGKAIGAPTVSITPAKLTFAPQTMGSASKPQIITIHNTSPAPVNFGDILLTGKNTRSFVKSATTCAPSLAAGKSCTISVEFKPAVTGALTASLAIADNTAATAHLIVITGTAIAAPTLSITPTTLTFPSQKEDTASKAQLITLRNTSKVIVNFGSILFTGKNTRSFVKSATTCATTLAAAKSCTISVEFKPAIPGALTASLAIASNAANSPQEVTLKGTATAAK